MGKIHMQETVGLDEQAADFEAISLRLGWLMRRRLEQRLDAFQLTLPQYMALNCIERYEGGCSMSELAEASHQLSATMTGIIDRLVERGLVVRERDLRDRRALRVRMTGEGRAVMMKVKAAKHAWTKQFLAGLTLEERANIIALSSRYLAVVENAVKDSSQPSGENRNHV